MMPATVTFRTLARSAIYRFPLPSTAIATGDCKLAPIAGPPSPFEPEKAEPPPATVPMIPAGVTFRTRLSAAMYRFPAPSAAIASGPENDAFVAGWPSPENPYVPLPATATILRSEEHTSELQSL